MTIRVGFLSLSQELIAMVKSVSSELPNDVEIVTEETNPLDSAGVLQTALKLEESCDAIISRTGTRAEIITQVSVPVIDLKFTLADVLHALYLARDKGKKILLILVRDTDQDLGPWPELLGIEVRKVLVDYRHEIAPAVMQVQEQDVVVVGGIVQVIYAENMGLKSQYILSGRETLLQTINKAVEIVRAASKEKERAARLQALLDFAHEGIIFLDNNNEVGYINSAATEILKTPRDQLEGKNLSEVFRANSHDLEEIFSSGSPMISKLLKLDDISIMANIVPILSGTQYAGTVLTFFEASRLQSLEHNFRRQMARKPMSAKFNLTDIIGKSKAIDTVKKQAAVYALTGSTVAIYGESGTGKELFAQSIHNLSNRRKGPFVAINCSALPKELMESELFGYEEGAFTGARKGGKEGLFELAHGGTLFLDEIGTMPLELQSKILRVIQEREVTRLGATNLIPVDVRIIVATNRNLREAVQHGEFRQDLFFRLNVLPLNIPPLRERPEDIPLLAQHFLKTFSRKMGWRLSTEDLRCIELLEDNYWPGNVRELENFCERFVAMASQETNKDELLKRLLLESMQDSDKKQRYDIAGDGNWIDDWHDLEKNVLEKMLNERRMTKTALAKSLGMSRTSLWNRLKDKK